MVERYDGVPRLLVGPASALEMEVRARETAEPAIEAVEAGGGRVVGNGEVADALVWLGGLDGLEATLLAHPQVRWVQLPLAGVERMAEAGLFADPRFAHITWTSAKGSYAKPVAEHALALALAGLRHLHERARARSWGERKGTSLYGAKVTILGGGGIAEELLRLLAPFGTEATVVRKKHAPLAGAARVMATEQVKDALPDALVVFVALALVPETVHIIGAEELELMAPGSWLVNVARGRHVDTDALVEALQAGRIGGAALDVTEPEPLPDGHPLWGLPNCLITPHSADTDEMIRPLLAERIRENVKRFAAGLPLEGAVDAAAGY